MKFIMKFIRKIRNPKNTESSLREDVSRTIERGRSLSDGRCFTGAFLVFVGFIGALLLVSVFDIVAALWAWPLCGELSVAACETLEEMRGRGGSAVLSEHALVVLIGAATVCAPLILARWIHPLRRAMATGIVLVLGLAERMGDQADERRLEGE